MNVYARGVKVCLCTRCIPANCNIFKINNKDTRKLFKIKYLRMDQVKIMRDRF